MQRVTAIEGRPKARVQTFFLVEDEDGRIVPEESMTAQSDVVRSDIKHILAKYEQTGVLVGMRQVDLAYRDVSEFTDFADLMRENAEAKQAFMRLPSKVRETFNHDVAEWLDAAHDGLSSEQRAKLEKLGFLEAVQVKEPLPARNADGTFKAAPEGSSAVSSDPQE